MVGPMGFDADGKRWRAKLVRRSVDSKLAEKSPLQRDEITKETADQIAAELCREFSMDVLERAWSHTIDDIRPAPTKEYFIKTDDYGFGHTESSIHRRVKYMAVQAARQDIDVLITLLEHVIHYHRNEKFGSSYVADGFWAANFIQAVLGDEFVGHTVHEIEDEDSRDGVWFEIWPIQAEVLDRELTRRTFRLTSNQKFAATNRDYEAAWRAHAKKDYRESTKRSADALESAIKTVLTKLNPQANVDDATIAKLSNKLVDAEILDEGTAAPLRNLIQHGAVAKTRNKETGHGQREINDPTESQSMLALNLTGTIVSYLIERLHAKQPPKGNQP